MSNDNKKELQTLSLVEAVETLSMIADLDIDHDLVVAETEEVPIQGKMLRYRTIHWLQEGETKEVIHLIRRTFSVVLHHLRRFYETEYRRLENQQAMEEIKTIMVLVGEAAKKIDHATQIFQKDKIKSVTGLKEYRQLQDFYLTHISRKIDENLLGKWILGLTKEVMARRIPLKEREIISESRRLFIDLDSVKKDSEYELFYLRKEDGTRFFNPRLIRNIKLVCDFGYYFGDDAVSDTLNNIKYWNDLVLHESGKSLLRAIQGQVSPFLHLQKKCEITELVGSVNKSLIALMMCANPANLLRNSPSKSCEQYFWDFQRFFKKAISTREYQKLLLYPPKESGQLTHLILNVIHAICHAMHQRISSYQQLKVVIQETIEDACQTQSPEHQEAVEMSHLLWNRMAYEYTSMRKWIGNHSTSPVNKILEALEADQTKSFSPLHMGNLPNRMYNLNMGGKTMTNLRLPSPTYQEYIQKAVISDEFKDYILALAQNPESDGHLLFNFQDRTSWKEHARCRALEELEHHENFRDRLTVVTLSKDSDFYHQLSPYHRENSAKIFVDAFLAQLSDEKCGFYFPEKIRQMLFPNFVKNLMEMVHQVFFFNRNALTREQRLNFIEIYYLLLELKILEIVKPDTFSFTCKDAIDTGAAASAEFYGFVKLLQGQKCEESDIECLNLILYGASLLLRERVIHPERFNRILSTFKAVENMDEELDIDKLRELSLSLYQKDSLRANVLPEPLNPGG